MSLEYLLQQLADAERRRDPDAQISILRQFLSIAQQNSNTPLEIHALRGLGNAYQEKDELSRAHSYRVTASQLADDPRSQCPLDLKMVVECDLGRSYIEARDWPKAEMHTQRAIALAKSLHRERDHCIFQLNMGVICAATGRLEEAHRLADEVQQLGERLHDHYILGLVHCNQAGWLLEETRLNDCQRHVRQALVHADHTGDAQIRMRVDKILGECYRVGRLATGRREYSSDAERHLREALEKARAVNNPSREYEAVTELAKLCEDLGRPDEAADHSRRALELLEQIRGCLGYEEFQLTFFHSMQRAYQSVTEFFLRQGRLDDAFVTAERLRSRVLLAHLGQERTNTPAWSSERRAELAAILDDFGGQVLRECRGSTRGPVRDMTVGARKKEKPAAAKEVAAADCVQSVSEDASPVAGARRRFIRLYEAQRVNRAVWRPQPATPVASLTQTQQRLGADEALLAYYVTERSLVIFVATRERAHFQHLAYPAEKLRDDIEAVCSAIGTLQDQALAGQPSLTRQPHDPWPEAVMSTVARLHQALEKLYALLLAPILAAVEDKTHWVIVPHGPLHRLPWCALRAGGRYLIERHSLSHLPSASLWALLQSRPAADMQTGVFLADPDPDDPALRLPGARQEVETVHGLFKQARPPLLGPQATKRALLEHVSAARLLHLACHHFFDASAPLLSFLKFAGSKGADFLYAFEIAELTLPAELVTLSACQSGRSQIATGDEQIGIVRAFLTAGVPSVISTLWSIEDESAATFFTDFYELAGKLLLAQALAQAQRRLLANPRYALPYFWAPYLLTGQWNKPLTLHAS